MRITSESLNEELRLQDLYNYEILDSETEKPFDDILDLAAQYFNCPIAAISFIDTNRQWFKSKIGLDDSETPRETAFCNHTIQNEEPFYIYDASKDKRFDSNPFVSGAAGIRFYAGAPIVSKKGYKLGSVCVIDNRPRELTDQQKKFLQILSGQISQLLELRLKNKMLQKTFSEKIESEKNLLRNTLDAQESELSYISTQLHEEIAQSLAATKFYLEIAESSSDHGPELISKCKGMIVNLMYHVQALSKMITPTTLKKLFLQESLQELLKIFEKKSGIKCSLIYQGHKELDFELALTIYRVIEDQLDNITRHSKATKLVVNLTISQSIFLSIKDNGVGFSLDNFKKGVGLNRILSRVNAYDGTVNITGYGQKKGCELLVSIPHPAGLHDKK